MPEPRASDAEANELQGPLASMRYGLPMGIFVVVSSMIGVGVLTTSGFTVASVGSNPLMLFLWVVGGIIALCGALCVAELAAALPSSGGDYIYLYEAYGPLAAFLTGWVSFLIGFAAPIAAAAFASASYLLAPLGLEPATARLANQGLASVAIVVFALIHTSKARHSTRAHSTVTLLKLGILCTFLVAGLYAGWGRWENLANRQSVDLNTAKAMLKANANRNPCSACCKVSLASCDLELGTTSARPGGKRDSSLPRTAFSSALPSSRIAARLTYPFV